eukprot:c47002_g1_i1 orf=466-1149(+)
MGKIFRFYRRMVPLWFCNFRKSYVCLKKISLYRKPCKVRAILIRSLQCANTRTESLRLETGWKQALLPVDCDDCKGFSTTAAIQKRKQEVAFTGKYKDVSQLHRNRETLHNKESQNISALQIPEATKEYELTETRDSIDHNINNYTTFIASQSALVRESIPVVKYSLDPYQDFHDSMLEMVLKNGYEDIRDLEELFFSYMCLNSPHNHGKIEEAFEDLLIGLCCCFW